MVYQEAGSWLRRLNMYYVLSFNQSLVVIFPFLKQKTEPVVSCSECTKSWGRRGGMFLFHSGFSGCWGLSNPAQEVVIWTLGLFTRATSQQQGLSGQHPTQADTCLQNWNDVFRIGQDILGPFLGLFDPVFGQKYQKVNGFDLRTHIPWTNWLSWVEKYWSHPLGNSKNIILVQQTCV